MGVSLSGYYAWRARPASKRAKVDADLKKYIEAFHTRSDGTYGAPRIWKDLMDVGVRISKKRVARLMREMGIYGVSRRKSTQTTVKAQKDRKAPDLVKR
ncbi:MAG: IS3 family transposase, partial [Candidatus Latescibacteria bacterium]|nr:IS3 family transposase [Candidatus Latescibacterota bacterium]